MIDGGPRSGADPPVDSKSGDKCTLEIKIADDLGKVNRPSASAPGLLAACSGQGKVLRLGRPVRSEEHTSELQSLMRISYAVFCLKKKNIKQNHDSKSDKHAS